MKYRLAKYSDSDILAKIHIQTFHDFFLSSLGYKFLNTYYLACLQSPDSIAICALNDDNEVIGFSIGCIYSKGFHKRIIIRNLFTFLYQAIRISIINPKALIRLSINLEKKANKEDIGDYSELLSIAVSNKYKGCGVGKNLINIFEVEVQKKGSKRIALTTDLNNNEHVISFYKNLGYNLFYEFTTYPHRKMYKLIKEM